MGKLIDDFRRDLHANNQRFRREMKTNNQQFRERISQAKQQRDASAAPQLKQPWRASRTLIILSLIFFFPLGLYLLWRHSDWSRTAKRLTAGAVIAGFIGVMTLAAVFAPPTLAVTSSLSPITGNAYTLTGNISPGDVVTVNGKAARVAGGAFTIDLTLAEGDNDLYVVVQSGSKQTAKHFVIHRFTHQEIAEQKRRAAEAKAREEARKQAEAKKAQQAKLAAAKKKAAEVAAKKKKAHDALVARQKAAAAAAQEKAQQAAAAQAAQQRAASASSSGSGYVNTNGNYIPSPSSNPSGATAKCRDGTYSYSQNHRGTCSHHGGVAVWL